jgi:2-polyprenyl-6-hydroxyphenyl methylase/3-demethylubiquinone-9 3-methyltransferase
MIRLALHSAKSTSRFIPRARTVHSSSWTLKPISNSSINPDEIAHFSRLSSQWWDESDGAEFALLHRMNPVRVQWILEKLEEARKDDAKDEWTDWRSPAKVQAPKLGRQLEGMSVLDVGCGGGLLSEVLITQNLSCTPLNDCPFLYAIDALSARGPHDRHRRLPKQYSYRHASCFRRSFLCFGRESTRVQAHQRRSTCWARGSV